MHLYITWLHKPEENNDMQVSPLIKNTSATVSDQRLDSGKVWEQGSYCLLSERLLPVSAGQWTLGLQFWQWLGQAYYQGSKYHTSPSLFPRPSVWWMCVYCTEDLGKRLTFTLYLRNIPQLRHSHVSIQQNNNTSYSLWQTQNIS